MYNNREEIHKTITKISDELRGSVDGWEFKAFVLGSLFYRFLSENITKYVNDSKIFEDYENTTDAAAEERKTEIKRNKGYYIKPSELFSNVCKSSQENKNLGETLRTVFKNIEESMKNEDGTNNFLGMFDDFDVDSNKLGNTTEKRNERLNQILTSINKMELNYDNSDVDVFGDAYEFLMQMYAGNAGKSGGEFYTPQEASELLARLATYGRESTKTIYDPTSGSGSLLMQAERIIGKENLDGIYGQEINNTSFNLSRINMILNNIPLSKINIACDDTLKEPHFLDKKFDVIVSNPPYSVPWNPSSELIKDPRFAPAGVLAPKSKGDWAFVMHCLHLLE